MNLNYIYINQIKNNNIYKAGIRLWQRFCAKSKKIELGKVLGKVFGKVE